MLKVTLQNGDFAAFYLRLDLPDTDMRRVFWHDNYVTLAPGECRVVTAHLAGQVESGGKLQISAWNLDTVKCDVQNL